MRSASTYRGARRNEARRDRGLPRQDHGLRKWREGRHAETANIHADLRARMLQANSAREAVAKAMVLAGPLAGPGVATHAFLTFYRGEKRTRVVNRIIRDLERSSRAA